jgi:DNA-binding LacI/PurR family transcriptional regulator
VGRDAVRILLDTIAGRAPSRRAPLALAAELVIRSSTGPVPVAEGGGLAEVT